MSIQVENNLRKEENTEIFEQKAHYMACSIAADGPANINKYFEPYISGANGELTASFRGYPLTGTKMNLPEGYTAVVVTEAKRPLAEDAERKFQVTGGFKEFTNWNWDKKPSENDKIVGALDWIQIAEAVTGGFKEFTNWNWDKKPSENDKIVGALDWIQIAEALHGDDNCT